LKNGGNFQSKDVATAMGNVLRYYQSTNENPQSLEDLKKKFDEKQNEIN